MKRRVYITLIIRLCVLSGCPSKTEPPDASVAVDAGPLDAGRVEVVDAGPPQPAELALIVTAPLADGGLEVVEEYVDPVKTVNVWIPVSLSDYRLRVFDDADRVVPSDDSAKDVDGGIDYAIAFVEPLRSGKTYRLTVESQQGAALEGYKDAEHVMKVRGQVEPEAKKLPKKKKH